jgi:hypothetical protein
VAEHRLAVRAVHVFAVEDRAAGGVLEVLPEQGPALDEGKPAEVLVADVQEIEGVETRLVAASAERGAKKSRKFPVDSPPLVVAPSRRAAITAQWCSKRRDRGGGPLFDGLF